MEYLQDFDLYLLIKINEYSHNPFLDTFMPVITHSGDSGALWIFIALLLLFSKKYRRVGILTLCALLLGALVGNIVLKNLIERARPFMAFDHVNLLISQPLGYSFPSGHALSSFAAATIIGSKLKPYAPLVIIMAILIAFSRLYLFVHYPLDVLCGAILGFLCAQIVLLLSKRLHQKLCFTSSL